jgi:hypothetical protein
MAKRDREFTPVLRGAIYCAPFCGGNCTKVAHDKAVRDSAKLAKKLGKGWKPRVWENLGWHWSVISPCGRWKIHPPKREGDTYVAFLGDKDSPGGKWAEHGKTVSAAIINTWRVASADLAYYASFNDAVRGIL